MEAPVMRPPMTRMTAEESQKITHPTMPEEVVKKFAELLGSKGSPSSDIDQTKDLTKLLSAKCEDDEVVLTIPSLDMCLTDGTGTTILPEVGETSGTKPPNDDSSSRPNMTASVLSVASDANIDIEREAAQNSAKKTSWTRSTLRYGVTAINSNISNSFSALLKSRVRSWTLLLLRHSLSTGDHKSRNQLLSMLAARIQVDSVDTSFKTLQFQPIPGARPKDSDIVLPLLFEVLLNIKIQDIPEKVTLRAPGTISAIFADGDSSEGIKKVIIWLDTDIFVKSMVDQARFVVTKAVSSVTNIPVAASDDSSLKVKGALLKGKDEPNHSANTDATTALGSIREAVKLPSSTVEKSPMLLKARKSALRLNSVLHGAKKTTASPSSSLRKTSSVTWEKPLQTFGAGFNTVPRDKKIQTPQQALTASKLKSFKSFGRPHAGDFGSGPQNATFGEFGRPMASMWGRDGRLAYHPRPMDTSGFGDQMGIVSGGVADKNATFDFRKIPGSVGSLLSAQVESGKTFSPAASAGAALLGRVASTSDGTATETIPRTATAVENSLMNKLR